MVQPLVNLQSNHNNNISVAAAPSESLNKEYCSYVSSSSVRSSFSSGGGPSLPPGGVHLVASNFAAPHCGGSSSAINISTTSDQVHFKVSGINKNKSLL